MIGKDKEKHTSNNNPKSNNTNQNNHNNQIHQTQKYQNSNNNINININQQSLSKTKSKKSNPSSIISQNNSASFFQNLTNHTNSNISNIPSDLSNNIKQEDRESGSSKNKNSVKSQYKFISKLVELLDTQDIADIISWNSDGTVIEIKNQRKFVDQVLPQHFKHNNFSNFVRQLNMYHFKKVKNYVTPGIIAYSNQYFIKGCSNLLSEINRRNQSTFQLNKDYSIFDNENIKDDSLANKLNFLFNKLFDLESKVKSLTNVNDNLLSNNITFMEDLKDKAYYINMLESLIFYIVNNLLPNNIIFSNENQYQNQNQNNLLIDGTHDFKSIENLVCTCDTSNMNISNANNNNSNVFKDKLKDDYFNSPDSPNSSTANLYNFCRQGSLSGFNSFNLGQLNEFIMSNQNCLSILPHENKQQNNINNSNNRSNLNNMNNINNIYNLGNVKLDNDKLSNNNLELNEFKKPKEIKLEEFDKTLNVTSGLNNIVLKLNDEKEKLIQSSESFKKNFCEKCFLQKKLKKSHSGVGSFYYKYHDVNINNININSNNNNINNNNNNNNSNNIHTNNEFDKNKFPNQNQIHNQNSFKEDFFKVILNKYKDFNLKNEKIQSKIFTKQKLPQLPSKHLQLKQDLLPNDPGYDQQLENNNINKNNNESPAKISNFKKYNKNSNQNTNTQNCSENICKPQPIKLKNSRQKKNSLNLNQVNPMNHCFSLENSSSSNGCNSIYEETSQYNYENKIGKSNK